MKRIKIHKTALIWCAVLIFLILLGGVAGLRFYWSGNRLTQKAENLIKDSLNRELAIGSLDYSLLQGTLNAKDIKIYNPQGMEKTPFITLPEVDVDIDLLSLLSEKPVIHKIKIIKPVIILAKDSAGRWNYENLLKPSAGPRKNYLIESIDIKNADVVINTDTPLEFKNLQLRLGPLSPRTPLSLQLESAWAQAPEAQLKLMGNIDWDRQKPAGQLNLELNQLAVQSVLSSFSRGSSGMSLPFMTQNQLVLSLESTGNYGLKFEGTYQPANKTGKESFSRGFYAGELFYDAHQDELKVLSAQLRDTTGLTIAVEGKMAHLSKDPELSVQLKPASIPAKTLLAWLDYHPAWLRETRDIQIKQLEYAGKPQSGLHQVKSKLYLEGAWLASPDKLWKIDKLAGNVSINYESRKKTPWIIQTDLQTGNLVYDRIPMDAFKGKAEFQLSNSGSWQSFNLQQGSLYLAGTPVTLRGTGDARHYQFMAEMTNLDVSRFPDALRKKLNIKQPEGVISGTLKGSGPYDSHGPHLFTGELNSKNLAFKIDNTYYPAGELAVQYSASLLPDKEILHFSDLSFYSLKEDWGFTTQLDTYYGTPGWAKGDFNIQQKPLQNWITLYEKYYPESAFSPATRWGGELAANGNYYFRKGTHFEPAIYQTHVFLNGVKTSWAEGPDSVYLANPEMELNLAGDDNSFPSGSGSFMSSAMRYLYSGSTIEGNTGGTLQLARYASDSTVLNLHLTDGELNESASSLQAQQLSGDVQLTMAASSTGKTQFNYQTDNLAMAELSHPQFKLDNLLLSLKGDRNYLNLSQAEAQAYGGKLHLQGQYEMDNPKPQFTFKGEFENLQGPELYNWMTTHYSDKYWPYPATAGTLSGKFDGLYETPSTSRLELALNLSKLNMEKEDITYLRKVSGDLLFSLSSSQLQVQPFTLDIEGKVKPEISGNVIDLFSSDSVMPFHGQMKLAEIPLSKLQDVFFEFLPSLVQDADIKGTAGISVEASQSTGAGMELKGGLTLKDVGLAVKDEFAVKGLQGILPLAKKKELAELKYPDRFRKEDYAQWLALFNQIEKEIPPDLTAETLQSGFIQMQNLKLVTEGSADGVGIPFMACDAFGGRIYGNLQFHASGGFDALLLLDNLSLKQITDAKESTRGMLSGRFNGMIQISSDGTGLSRMKGTAQLWAIKSKDEKSEFSKEFLKKAAGRDLPPLFIQRHYDIARVRLSLKEGYLVFNDLLIQGNAFGRPFTQIGINASGNKVSLDKFIDWIQEAAAGTSNIKTEIK